jgi:hypothetical protein
LRLTYQLFCQRCQGLHRASGRLQVEIISNMGTRSDSLLGELLVNNTVDLGEIRISKLETRQRTRFHGSDGSVKEPKDRGQGSRIEVVTILGISRGLIDYTCISKGRSESPLRPLFANLRSALAFCFFIHEFDVGHLHPESVRVQDMSAARRCVSKIIRRFAGGRR